MNQLNIFLNNLEHNYKVLRSHINNDTELIAVLKASAYGSEIVRISYQLESLGVNQIAVAYVDEGVYLRKQGVKNTYSCFLSSGRKLWKNYKI